MSNTPAMKQPKSKSGRAKITIIGGGSPYCTGFLKSLARQADTFPGCHITLMDINKEGLNLIYTLGSKLLRHVGADITLEQTTSQKAAIADADIVFTIFHMGGMQARIFDEKLPLRHNLIGDEIAGAGGFFSALRTIPIIARIAAEMEKTAPRAFLLNYTHPSNIVTEAVAHCSGIRVIGLCDAPLQEIRHVAYNAGVGPADEKRLYQRTLGLNHGNWTTAVWRDGVDILPQIIAWAEQYAQQKMTPANYRKVMLALLITHYKAIPSYDMHYYYFPELVLSFLQQKPSTRAEDILTMLPDIVSHYREEAQKDVPQLTKIRDSDDFGDFALNMLRSIFNNTGEEWILNVPNNGAINFFAHDRVVELPCRVDARGATPLVQGDGGLDIDQRGLLYQLAEYEGATARAALWGTRHDAIKALTANPLVSSYSKAEAVYNDLAAAHARYLPKRLLK